MQANPMLLFLNGNVLGLLTTCLFLCLLCILAQSIFARKSTDAFFHGHLPPGDFGLPFFGNTLSFLRRKGTFLREKRQEYGDIYKMNLFHRPTIRVTGIENVTTILKGENSSVISAYPSTVKTLLGEHGLLMSEGMGHRLLKKSFTHWLSNLFLANHVSKLTDVIQTRIWKWTDQKDGIDIFEECGSLASEIFIKTIINAEIDEIDLTEMVKTMKIFNGNMFCLHVYVPGTSYYRAWQAKAKFKKLLAKQVKTFSDLESSFSTILKEMLCYSDTDHEITESESVFDAIIELLFAGGETLTSALFCLVYLLGKHANELDKVQEEMRKNAMTRRDSLALKTKSRRSLVTVNNIVRESLRVLPPIGGVYRNVIEPFNLQGYDFPKDWTVIAGIRESHENDSSIEQPLDFNPDRWNNTAAHPALLSFGLGPRVCPGRNFAKLILNIFVTELAQNCEIELSQTDIPLDFFPTPRPKGKLNVRFIS